MLFDLIMCISTLVMVVKPATRPTQVRVAWHCTCFNVRRTSRLVTQFYDSVMESSGVRATQFTMLGAVSMLGPVTVSQLAEQLALDRTTLTRNLKVLTDRGLVEITTGKDDRRKRVATVTPAGIEAIERATPAWQEAQQRIVTAFGEDRWRSMIEDLSELGQVTSAREEDQRQPGVKPGLPAR